MEILFIAENLLYGGREKKLIDLANSLANRGFKVSFFLYGSSIQLEDRIDNKINMIQDVVDESEKNWIQRNVIYRMKCINKINKFVKKSNFNLIISFDDNVNINILLSKQSRKKKILLSERGDPNSNKSYLKLFKKLLYRFADAIVFQTEGAQEYFEGLITDKTTVIPNPIPFRKNDINIYNGIREKTIVNVARLELYQKRQDVLLEAFKKFSEEFNDYKLVLYGDGPDRDKIIEIVNQLKLQNKVILAGQQNDVLNKIRKDGIFVLSSDFEGMPNALIEAMAMGLPVISTDCSPGGARYLINNQENGLLISRDDVEELYLAMKYLAKNPDIAKDMGNNALTIIDRFDRKKIYDKWEKFITTI